MTDIERVMDIRGTKPEDREKFLSEMSEFVKTMPSSYEFYADYCLWLVMQNPKFLMPWEDGFKDERAQRVVNALMKW